MGIRSVVGLALSSVLVLSFGFGCSSEVEGGDGSGDSGAAGGQGGDGAVPLVKTDALVHLFEWKWSDVAKECEAYLGPKGFSGVQISPPSEHVVLGTKPWWQRYQVVSYSLESRSGSAAEFRDMVTRCRASGVEIYVDAVINHMTAQVQGTGSGGTKFTKYEYPGLYSAADFHETCAIAGSDYQSNPDGVQSCELLGLSDLDTGNAAVRAKIVAYLSGLVKMGVRGFRIDAAKHIAPLELRAIVDEVRASVDVDEIPKYYLEVIDRGGEAISSGDYLSAFLDLDEVSINEFKYDLTNEYFLGVNGKKLADLSQFADESWGLLPSERAVVFSNNHDTQRASALYYADGASYLLGNVFLLGHPYGRPLIMSSYAFSRDLPGGKDKGPPSDAEGNTLSPFGDDPETPACAPDFASAAIGSWVCEHRLPHVAAMLAFREATKGAAVSDPFNDGENVLAFGRGDRGYVVLNGGDVPFSGRLTTGLRAGTYCDVLAADECSPIVVGSGGEADVTVPARGAVVVHVGRMQ